MQINQKFLEVLLPVLFGLRKNINCDFVVFGSAPLYLLGVTSFKKAENINDLDVVVESDFVPSGEMQEVLFHDDPRQKFYKIEIGGINVDIGPGGKRFMRKFLVRHLK